MAGYGSDDDFAAWLAAHGLTLPASAPAPAVLRQIGSTYVDGAYEYRLSCSHRAGGFAQERAWPRTGHTVDRQVVPEDLVPPPWVDASFRAAYLTAVTPGWATSGLDPSRLTKREKAGEIEQEFFEAGKGAVQGNAAPGFRVDPLIDGALAGWLCPVSSTHGLGIWTVGG
ncbi:DnaT-like ssDNA-binding protein [Neotabrizicola sp. VNH66]|uniref:DnaT-like ssDNA-binding protein n=1 Tax=Neotabrizicola sp. VNH66 TaxID=3400918 RepID=UPI003C0C1819